MGTADLRMSTEGSAQVPEQVLGLVVAGLTRCHGHHFAVYADEATIVGSRLAITECIPRLLNALKMPEPDLSNVVQLGDPRPRATYHLGGGVEFSDPSLYDKLAVPGQGSDDTLSDR